MSLVLRRRRVSRTLGLAMFCGLAFAACGDGDADGAGGATIRGAVTVVGEKAAGVSVQLSPFSAEGEGQIESPAGDEVLAETTTDGQGGYEFGGLEPGSYLVSADVVVPEIGGSGCRVLHTVDEVPRDGVATADIEVSEADVDAYFGGIGLLFSGDLMACFE